MNQSVLKSMGILSVVLPLTLVGNVGCRHATPRVLTIPPSDADAKEIVAVLQSSGNPYASYSITAAPAQVETGSISVAVINGFNSYTGLSQEGNTLFTSAVEVSPKERDEVTRTLLVSTRAHLGKTLHLSESAQYRILILVQDSGGDIYFDSNQNPMVVMNTRVLLLDTKAKTVLWYTNSAVALADTVKHVTEAASARINDRLDFLLGMTRR